MTDPYRVIIFVYVIEEECAVFPSQSFVHITIITDSAKQEHTLQLEDLPLFSFYFVSLETAAPNKFCVFLFFLLVGLSRGTWIIDLTSPQ